MNSVSYSKGYWISFYPLAYPFNVENNLMNIWDHSRLSRRKFGGKEEDYYHIHKFIDSSKLFYFNPRHRLLLHNLYGIELCVQKFGDTLVNEENRRILIRDIAAEHCKEDLSGKVPSLAQWLAAYEPKSTDRLEVPKFEDQELETFVLAPYFRSNLASSLMITLSNFGVYLTQEFLGIDKAKKLQAKIKNNPTIDQHLAQFNFSQAWQFSPSKKELDWLAQNPENKSTWIK